MFRDIWKEKYTKIQSDNACIVRNICLICVSACNYPASDALIDMITINKTTISCNENEKREKEKQKINIQK